MSIDHFIITRINRPLGNPQSGAKRHRLDWVEYRFSLMDAYATPSILGQTQRRFQWVWEIDPESPANVKRLIERKAAEAGARIVVDRKWHPGGVILMTRFDSDDFLSKTFVEVVQKAALSDARRPLVVDAPGGWITDGRRAWEFDNPSSSFISLVANPKTHGDIWQCQHKQLVHRFPSVAAPGRLWCRVVHGENLTNRLDRCHGPGIPLSQLEKH